MARIRSIKPEFWSSEQVMECARDTRLLFIGLWNFVDDAGRMSFSAKQIKALIFPGDDLSPSAVAAMLEELAERSLIETYEVNDKRYLAITGWRKHQRIDKPQPPRCPAPPERAARAAPPAFAEQSPNGRDGEEGKGAERDSDSVAEATACASESDAREVFEEFWKVRLKRDGPDPREPARRAFMEALKAGADPSAILAGMRRFAELHADKANTRFVARTEKWLREKSWEDYPQLADPRAQGQVWLRGDDARFKAWDRHLQASRGKGAPTDARGGWLFPAEWPPGDARGERKRDAEVPLALLLTGKTTR
jgi:hypothetical protein